MKCSVHQISIGEAGCPLCPKSREERKGGKVKVRGSSLRVDPKKKLKTAGKPERYMDGDSMQALVEAVAKRDGFTCIGDRLGYDHECHPSKEALHLVDQRTLGHDHPALTDPDICVYGCRLLNNWLDEWHGPLVNVRERVRLRAFAGDRFEAAVFKYDLQVEADRKFEGAGA